MQNSTIGGDEKSRIKTDAVEREKYQRRNSNYSMEDGETNVKNRINQRRRPMIPTVYRNSTVSWCFSEVQHQMIFGGAAVVSIVQLHAYSMTVSVWLMRQTMLIKLLV